MSSENLSNDVLNLLNRLSNNDEEKMKELILTGDLVKTMFRSRARNVSTPVDDELKKLRESIDQIISKCEFPGCGDVRKKLENFYKKLKKINEFPELYKQQIVSVVGAFSAGKSAFLKRCLLEPNEKDISLPIDTEPSTAILTYIDLSDRDKSSSEIVWTDHHGRFHPLQKNEMKKFSHTTGEKMAVPEDFFPTIVKDLRISLPVEKWNKLLFIDTPGFNTNNGDKSLMDAAILQADHVIWVINGNDGAIKNDSLDVLKKLFDKKIPVYLLITHLEKSPEKRQMFLEIQKKHLPELKEKNITFACIDEEKEKVHKWFDSIQQRTKKVSFINEFNEICNSLINCIPMVENNVNQDIEQSRYYQSIKKEIGDKKNEVIRLIKELLKNLDICDDSQEKTSYYAYFRGQKNWENNTFEGNVDRILELLPGVFCCILTVPAISNIELITDFDFAKKLVDNGMVKNKIKLSFDHSDNENCVFRIDCDEDISKNQSQEVKLKKKLVSVLKPRIDSNCGVNAAGSSADTDDILPLPNKMYLLSDRLLYFSVFAMLAYKESCCDDNVKERLNPCADYLKLPSKTVSDFLKKLWNNPNSDYIFTQTLREYVFAAFCDLVKNTKGTCIKKDITDILTSSSIPKELVSTYPQYILAYPKANEPMRREIEEYVPGEEATNFLSIIRIFTPEWKFTDLTQQAQNPSSSETEVQYYSVNETRTFKDCVNFKNMVFLFGPKGKFVFQNNCSFTCCRFIASSNHDKKPSGSPLLECKLKCKQASFENCGFYGRDVRYGIEGKLHKMIKMTNCVMSHLRPTGDEACIESDYDDSSFDNCFFCDCKGKYMIYRGSVRNSKFLNFKYCKRLINEYGKNNQYNNNRVIYCMLFDKKFTNYENYENTEEYKEHASGFRCED